MNWIPNDNGGWVSKAMRELWPSRFANPLNRFRFAPISTVNPVHNILLFMSDEEVRGLTRGRAAV